MSPSPLSQIIQLTSQFLWPVFTAAMLLAAILFLRADRRSHTYCLLIGCIIQFLDSLWSLIWFSPLFGLITRIHEADPSQFQKIMAIQSGTRLVEQGLICYGLLMIALIQYRKSRDPFLGRETADSA